MAATQKMGPPTNLCARRHLTTHVHGGVAWRGLVCYHVVQTVVTVSDARRKKSNVPLPCPTARPGVVPAGVHIAPPTDYDPGEWPLVSTP